MFYLVHYFLSLNTRFSNFISLLLSQSAIKALRSLFIKEKLGKQRIMAEDCLLEIFYAWLMHFNWLIILLSNILTVYFVYSVHKSCVLHPNLRFFLVSKIFILKVSMHFNIVLF